METMRSVLCIAPGKVEILEVAVPEPEPNEVLIETRAVGLCTSDVYVLTGESPDKYPAINALGKLKSSIGDPKCFFINSLSVLVNLSGVAVMPNKKVGVKYSITFEYVFAGA